MLFALLFLGHTGAVEVQTRASALMCSAVVGIVAASLDSFVRQPSLLRTRVKNPLMLCGNATSCQLLRRVYSTQYRAYYTVASFVIARTRGAIGNFLPWKKHFDSFQIQLAESAVIRDEPDVANQFSNEDMR